MARAHGEQVWWEEGDAHPTGPDCDSLGMNRRRIAEAVSTWLLLNITDFSHRKKKKKGRGGRKEKIS